VVLYTYVGYGLIIYILSKLVGRKNGVDNQSDEYLPPITLLVAAYNEERFIEPKIKNSLSLNYPPEKLNLWIVADGSTDRTVEISERFSETKTFHQAARMGKIHAVNRVMKLVETPIVIFSDANTILNHDEIKNIVRHFIDEKVGGVAGEKQIANNK
jgi:cellulose synthase/poly-beta-1,6-N-acetylglucosamine synthase-like glycosyltransferase